MFGNNYLKKQKTLNSRFRGNDETFASNSFGKWRIGQRFFGWCLWRENYAMRRYFIALLLGLFRRMTMKGTWKAHGKEVVVGK